MTWVQVQQQAVVYGHWATLDNILSCTTLVERKSIQTEPEPMSLPLNHLSYIRYPGPEMTYDAPDSTLALIGGNAKNLKNLTIIMIHWPQDTIRMGLIPMFRGLKVS